MFTRIIKSVLCITVILNIVTICNGTIQYLKPSEKWPTIVITSLVRNKENALPYFLSCLQKIDYPKDRIIIWFYSDYNSDNSDNILKEWISSHSSEYHEIHISTNTTTALLHPDQETITHWSALRYQHVIQLREKALNFARNVWADYLFMLDADVLLSEPLTLKLLINKDLAITAPMLISDGAYSNFWCGMDEFYYYKRTEEYRPILKRKEIGCFKVPMVHSAVLINLKSKDSDLLTYVPRNIKDYDGPEDDIIAFAVGARKNGIPMHICNEHIYGFVPVPLEKDNDDDDKEEMLNVKMEALGNEVYLPLDKNLAKYVHYPKTTELNCTQIFMINLERRKKRRDLMNASFVELGIVSKWFKAIDGKSLTKEDIIKKYNIKLLPNYEDPYHKRPMKAGEIGCFLSHYFIWKKIVENHYNTTLILEDDIHFVPYFKEKFLTVLQEIRQIDWDLLYIGRKILLDDEEPFVTEHTVKPKYSYWTLGYVLRESGAKKLLAADPLSKLLPVDEYLPIMFDQHPTTQWVEHFPIRDLKALSAAPLLVHPTHYTGEDGYISDTEDSIIMDPKVERTDL
ncbi:glycosyltransferase 25 family member [Pieris rapae]|uniref:glycosyltransferase 25 family member n=1 Tax=Pieris rapae TaxID=64459 RepID=UPI001E27B657|nr:glycosyltransferase 25 family member [Pieris rapae]